MSSQQRLQSALNTARLDLLNQRTAAGHWVGQLSTSALSTATAVSALAIAHQQLGQDPRRAHFQALAARGVDWLVRHQNADGGWGDTTKSYSNVATSMLVLAAIELAQATAQHSEAVRRGSRYVQSADGVDGLRRRYGRDKTFAVPILTNAALAGQVPWQQVAPLPFEWACLPQRFYRLVRLPVVSYAIPALVAIGQARFVHRPPGNPLVRWIRRASVERSLRVLHGMQPESGGFLEAVPLTSFVVMSLASIGRARHDVAQRGLQFLMNGVLDDGSWPIDTNLATWNTTLAINALASGGYDVSQLDCWDWLLNCQTRHVHPYTGAAAGGWGWSDLSGSVPDADDTPGAVLALAHRAGMANCPADERQRIEQAVQSGIDWLLGLQNRDGGWPTFCRGWGKLPFDRSGTDLTAHVLRCFHAWDDAPWARPAMRSAIERGWRYLQRTQQADGSWLPLWFGNQDHQGETNPVYGTAKVLMALRDLGYMNTPVARRGLSYLIGSQQPDGGWGGGPAAEGDGASGAEQNAQSTWRSSVEETALAVEALLAAPDRVPEVILSKGLEWIVSRVENGGHRISWPIGFYFAKLWYYEVLYPYSFTVSVLGQAVQQQAHTLIAPSPAPA